MRALAVQAAITPLGVAGDRLGSQMLLAEQVLPFSPGASAVLLVASRALANATVVVESTEAEGETTAVAAEAIGTTSGAGALSGLFDNGAIVPGTVVITCDGEEITDDGEGVLAGDVAATGTIDYTTGVFTIASASFSEAATADYDYLDYGAWDEVASVVQTTAKTTMDFIEVTLPAGRMRARVETAGGTGAGAAGVYLLGV